MAIDSFSYVTLPWIFYLISSFIIDFVLFWLKTSTFNSFLWTIKSVILTFPLIMWCNTDLKRVVTCCVADIDLSKITEQILATCLVSVMYPDQPLSVGRGSPFYIKIKYVHFQWDLLFSWYIFFKSMLTRIRYICCSWVFIYCHISFLFHFGKGCSQPSNNQMSQSHIFICWLMMGYNCIFVFFPEGACGRPL